MFVWLFANILSWLCFLFVSGFDEEPSEETDDISKEKFLLDLINDRFDDHYSGLPKNDSDVSTKDGKNEVTSSEKNSPYEVKIFLFFVTPKHMFNFFCIHHILYFLTKT